MRLGVSIAASGGRQPTPFWSAPVYLATAADGSNQHGPAAILDLRQDRFALSGVPAGDVPLASTAALTALSARQLTDILGFTRAGSATYIDADGLLQLAAADQPRFDYTHGRRQLLLEGPATNLLTYSNDLTNAAWLKTRVSAAKAETGPSGAPDDACAIVAAPEAGSHYIYRPVTFSAQPYTLTLRVKYAGHRWFYIRLYDGSNLPLASFDLLNGVAGNTSGAVARTMTADGNGFYKITVTATMAAGTGNVLLGLNATDAAGIDGWTPTGAEKVIVHGTQLETGSHSTSYIPTAGTTVTRPADRAQLTEPVAALLRREEASVLVQGEGISGSSPFTGGRLLSGPDGSDAVYLLNTLGTSINAASPVMELATVAAPLPGFGIAAGWDGSTLSGSYNAGAVQSRSGMQEAVLSTAYLGRNETAIAFAAGWYDQLMIWPFRMTDADLQAKAVAYA